MAVRGHGQFEGDDGNGAGTLTPRVKRRKLVQEGCIDQRVLYVRVEDVQVLLAWLGPGSGSDLGLGSGLGLGPGLAVEVLLTSEHPPGERIGVRAE